MDVRDFEPHLLVQLKSIGVVTEDVQSHEFHILGFEYLIQCHQSLLAESLTAKFLVDHEIVAEGAAGCFVHFDFHPQDAHLLSRRLVHDGVDELVLALQAVRQEFVEFRARFFQ